MALEAIEEEGGLILKEGFMLLISKGIMDKLPTIENTGPTSSNTSLCLLSVSVRLRFLCLIDCEMSYSHQRTTQTKRYLP